MSLFERIRTLRGAGSPDGTRAVSARLAGLASPPWRVAGLGAAAALTSWSVLVLLAVIVWAFTPQGEAGLGEVLALASGAWVLLTGGSVTGGDLPITIVPLLGWVLAVWIAMAAVKRARLVDPDQSVGALAGRFCGGYAAALSAISLLALAGPVVPVWHGPITALSVPAVALGQDVIRDPPEWLAQRLPVWLEAAWRPAGAALLTLGGVGLALVVAAVWSRWETVVELYGAVDAGGIGAVMLTIVQLLFLPNLVLWAVAVVAGPGFQVAIDSAVTVTGAEPGLLPIVPILGAVPTEEAFPGWLRITLLLPVVAGLVIGRTVRRHRVPPMHESGLARTAAVAVALDSGVILVLGLLASGSVGVSRLAHVGPDPWDLAGVVLVELAVGTALWFSGSLWIAPRLRRLRSATGSRGG